MFVYYLKKTILFNKKFFFLKRLNDILGFFPKNRKLLREVFIYNLLSKEKKLSKNCSIKFQRLEFLGDSVINMIISHFLYEKFPNKDEGELTQIRSKIVCRKNLNKISRKLSLQDFFYDKNILCNNNILGNTLEALIGFIYLEFGYIKCKNFIYDKILNNHIDIVKLQNKIFSYKVWIMEWCQKNKFFVICRTNEFDKKLNNKIIYLSEFKILEFNIHVEGKGFSKKESEEIAAKKAYYKIHKRTYKQKKLNE